MRSSELSSCLETIQSLATMTNIIIVPGGGEFADKVREMQTLLKFDNQVAHRLALLAMSQYGYLLAGMSKNIQLVEDLGVLSSNLNRRKPLLWLPMSLTKDESEIPASWDFTSDSIALWLAIKLAASKLILVKAKVFNQKETSLNEHIDNGDLDQGFQELVDKFLGEIHLINKSQYQDIERLILNKKTYPESRLH
jgi:5-(aminomethyl)-3-furanmethanol phosphate kinase